MTIALSTVRLFDYCVLGISGTCCLLCIAGAAYVVPWTKGRKSLAASIHDFTLYWKVRVLLQLLGAAWVLAQWLRLAALWAPDSPVFPERVTSWSRNGGLCRVYLCVSVGLLEPLFLLCALLLCHGALSTKPKQGLWPNAWVVSLALLVSLPVIIAQSVIAWIETAILSRSWDSQSKSLPHHFLSPFYLGSPQECGDGAVQGCALCAFPAASCIISTTAVALWMLMFGRITRQLLAAAINRRLKTRLRCFQWSVSALLACGAALRCVTLTGSPFTWSFQATWFLHFLTIPLLLGVVSLVLVIVPTREAYTSHRPMPTQTADLAREAGTPLGLRV